MRNKGLLIAALVTVGVGLIGGIATTAFLGRIDSDDLSGDGGRRRPRDRGELSGYSSNGERIYYTGVGHDGRITVEWDPSRSFGGGMMGGRGGRGRRGTIGMGCVRCHRADGRGGVLGMMGGLTEAPDIRYSTLTRAVPETGEDETATVDAGWTDADIARAITEGLEPDGERLDPLMPRWQMDGIDMRDTIDYLKELSDR